MRLLGIRKRNRMLKALRLYGGIFCAVSVFLLADPRAAYAVQCTECACSEAAHQLTRKFIEEMHTETREKYFGFAEPIPVPGQGPKGRPIGLGRLGEYQQWFIDVLFIENILPNLQMMTEQLVTVMMNQVLSIGAIMDAKQQLETQRLFRELQAAAHKDYQPSTGMCIIGTGTRSLAAAERNAEMTAAVLSQHAIKRQFGNGVVSGAEGGEGSEGDRRDRLALFSLRFCDHDDNDRLDAMPGTGLLLVCEGRARNPLSNVNEDIDYTRTIADPDTIQLDMTNNGASEQEPIFALQKNLYGHDLMPRMTAGQLKQENARDEVMDYRSVVAKRSVATNAYDTLVGLKAMGTPAGAGTGMGSGDMLQYMSLLMQDLGIPEPEVRREIGDRPSYYAQLKFLAKRLYQRPEFYVDLYDTPQNVERKKVAMQAINSILEREIYNSRTRGEAILSQILELHVVKRQADVENAQNLLDRGME